MNSLKLIMLGILLGQYACVNKQNKEKGKDQSKKVNAIDFVYPVVLDTLNPKTTIEFNFPHRFGKYNPLYIGLRHDSIYFARRSNQEKYYDYEVSKRHYNFPDSLGILLRVNTSQIISDTLIFGETNEIMIRKSFPVFLINTTKDSLNIGSGDHFSMFLEAMDSTGNWQSIEEPFIYGCGTGLNSIILPPNEIAVTFTTMQDGEFKTKLRLRYHNILSQEFNGSINLSQFQRK
jgi:hypothetical protein